MNFTKNKYSGLFVAVLTLFLAACSNDGLDIPDISDIKVDIKIKRFDQDLFSLDTSKLSAGMLALEQKYPIMLPLFAGTIIRDQTNPKETQEEAVRGFISAPQVRKLYDTVQQVYGDLRWLEKDLSRMFRFYKHYFPAKMVPEVVSVVSEFGTDAFTYGDSLCGIGLDLFLGENYPGYNPEIFPSYIRRQFSKDYIKVRLAKAIAQNAIDNMQAKNRLLDIMLYNGKMLYITNCLLPETPDSVIMGYTREQMLGCYANEQASWARLLSQNLLYSSDYETFKKAVTPSPDAPIVFREAPGEIGNWLGWRIIKSYMKRNPETSIDALLKLDDSQKILELAKYKPKN